MTHLRTLSHSRGVFGLLSAAVGIFATQPQAIAAGEFALDFDHPTLADVGVAVAEQPIAADDAANPSPPLLPVPALPSFVPLIATESSTQRLPPPPSTLTPRAITQSPSSPTLNSTSNEPEQPPQSPRVEDLFVGGPDSLVAKAVGNAEGTRTAAGGYTAAYYGHVDPGNRAWNLGSFSYQHGANTPEEADAKQLQRLQGQVQTLQSQAVKKSLALTLAQTLNGIDLANQAPATALGRGGYIDRLAQAHNLGLRGDEAVLWARTRSFLNPDTQRWNAPGLGNTIEQITQDQSRRQQAIQTTIAATQLSPAAVIQVAQKPANPGDPAAVDAVVTSPDETEIAIQEALADDLISLDLPPI
ncbi:MAG: hypothetical protein AAFW84_03260 [Cyanobacteria bacterium J06635_15]